METLPSITGNWHGRYAFDSTEQRQPVPFLLILKQGWFCRFSGALTEDVRLGMPGTDTINGRLAFPRIHVTKQMPVSQYLRL